MSSSVPDIGRHWSMNTIIPQLLLACISLQLPPHADFLPPLAGAPPPPPLHKWARGDARERGAAEKAAACQGLQGDLSTTVTGTTLAPRGKLRAQRQPHRRRAGELILTNCSLHCLSKIVTLVFDIGSLVISFTPKNVPGSQCTEKLMSQNQNQQMKPRS